MIKCPNCGAEIALDYEDDIEATMWNFYGDCADVEMLLYCEECEETCLVIQRYNMTPIGEPKIYKRR